VSESVATHKLGTSLTGEWVSIRRLFLSNGRSEESVTEECKCNCIRGAPKKSSSKGNRKKRGNLKLGLGSLVEFGA